MCVFILTVTFIFVCKVTVKYIEEIEKEVKL